MQSKAAASFIITLFALAGLAATYLAAHRVQNYLINSDALYLPTLFQDLLERGGALKDWYLTPAPYFFPDYVIYFFAYIAGKDPYRQILIYSVMQALAAYMVFYFFFASFRIRHAIPLSILAWLILISLALNAGGPFPFLLVSAHHAGAFLCAVLCVALAMQYNHAISSKLPRIQQLSLGIICFITALSDNLFVVQLVLPLSTLLCLAALFWRKRLFIQGIFVGTGGLLGSLSYPLFVTNATRYNLGLNMDAISKNAHDVISIIEALFKNEPIAVVLMAIFYAFTFMCFIGALNRTFFNAIGADVIALALFVLLSTIVTLLVALLSLTANVPMTPRYFIAAFSWPILAGLVIVARLLRGGLSRTITVASVTASTYLTVVLAEPIMADGIQVDFQPSEIPCIDKALEGRNVTYGIGGYWDAKYLQTFSAKDLIIAQHESDLDEFRWITSKRFFRNKYDFAVISTNAASEFKLSEDLISRINGAPGQIVNCGAKILMLYGSEKLRTTKITDVNDAFEWKGCELPTRVGKYNSACEIEFDGHESGFVSFGPYERLGAGKYHFEIQYSSKESFNKIIGDWDVVVGLPNEEKVLTTGVMRGTEGQLRKIFGDFALRSPKKIEIRTLAHENTSVRLVSLKVSRTE